MANLPSSRAGSSPSANTTPSPPTSTSTSRAAAPRSTPTVRPEPSRRCSTITPQAIRAAGKNRSPAGAGTALASPSHPPPPGWPGPPFPAAARPAGVRRVPRGSRHRYARTPVAAHLLEIATTISATSGAVIKAAQAPGQRPGAVRLRGDHRSQSRTGRTLQIPQRIVLALSPYEGMDPFRVDARFRYRLHTGAVRSPSCSIGRMTSCELPFPPCSAR